MKRLERILEIVNQSYKVDDVKEIVFASEDKKYKVVIKVDHIEIQDQDGNVVKKDFHGSYSYTDLEEKIIMDDKKTEKIYEY